MQPRTNFPCGVLRIAALAVASLFGIASISCSGDRPIESAPLPLATPVQPVDGPSGWPQGIPLDRLQPWEELDAAGHVVPQGRVPSAAGAAPVFIPGVECFSSSDDVSGNGEASRLMSAPGTGSHVMYRIPLGVEEAGTFCVDANLLGGDGYYIGLADYSNSRWQWHGPFTANHVQLDASGSDYTSQLGNLFACVLVQGGAGCDVVGVGMIPLDKADTTAPPVPGMPSLSPAAGGLLLQWQPVVADDLAGYRIHYCGESFSGPGPGVSSVPYIEAATQHLLPATGTAFVRITAVDFSGNESLPSAESSGTALAPGTAPMVLSASRPSSMLGGELQLVSSGAASYDFDLDGDGGFELTGNRTGEARIVASSAGIIRPRVRGYDAGGMLQSCGSISVIVSSNQRPVAVAAGSPTTGSAPLDVDFNGLGSADFDGTLVGGGWDFDNDGTYDLWADSDTMHLTAAAHQFSTNGIYTAKLRVVDDRGAWDVDSVAVLVSPAAGNIPPVAVLQGSQFTGQDSLDVTFSAAGSHDLDGSIGDYEWDLDGDGLFNEAGVEQESRGSDSPPRQTYHAGPHVVVSLRVTDNLAASSSAKFTVIVHGWSSQAVDAEGFVGNHTSMSLVGGNPGICYYDPTNKDLKFVRALDGQGSSWASPVVVDAAGEVGIYTSLAVADGYPAICYYDQTNDELRYVRALDASGSSWAAPIAVDSDGNVGGYTSMAIVDGNPAISYYDFTNGDLAYVRALDASGSSWAVPVTADSTDDVGVDTSLAVVDGFPAISYTGYTAQKLFFVRALDATGNSWGTPVELDGIQNDGFLKSMSVVDGSPAVSYFGTGYTLKYVRALDASGSSWGTPMTLDSAGNVGRHSSIAVVQGRPAISYRDESNGVVKFIWAEDADGGNWASPVVVDSNGDVGYYTCLLSVGDVPAICYYDWDNRDLKYALLY